MIIQNRTTCFTVVIDQGVVELALGELGLLLALPLVSEIIVSGKGAPSVSALPTRCRYIAGSLSEGAVLAKVFAEIKTPLAMIISAQDGTITPTYCCFERLHEVASATHVPMIYADYSFTKNYQQTKVFLNDYQLGSARDDFDFGGMLVFDVTQSRKMLAKITNFNSILYSSLYALRLELALIAIPFHIREHLYNFQKRTDVYGGKAMFAYLDPRNKEIQQEREAIFTSYLRQLGAFLEPSQKQAPTTGEFPTEVSVIIPVKNRMGKISDAIISASKQKTTFPFNIIVVDNHSTDGTTDMVAFLAKQFPALYHLQPERTDLEIGGCWNEAIQAPVCGRYAVQLDSDDMYADEFVLENIRNKFLETSCAMVIGSYSLVDMKLNSVPPGLIAHDEWTDINGHNNALRVNGLGAPRAFSTEIVRRFGFPNVSYGEDYAVALRICREYKIGRIFENLYLCRRWEGNTDAQLSMELKNKYDAYKDHLRTIEIMARRVLNRQ